MDIVEQLRKSANIVYKQDGYTFRLGLQNEAADEIERLREKYEEAIDDIEEWGAYASEYFQEKWKLKECIEQHRAALKEAE